jgi:hypothetical protein
LIFLKFKNKIGDNANGITIKKLNPFWDKRNRQTINNTVNAPAKIPVAN